MDDRQLVVADQHRWRARGRVWIAFEGIASNFLPPLNAGTRGQRCINREGAREAIGRLGV